MTVRRSLVAAALTAAVLGAAACSGSTTAAGSAAPSPAAPSPGTPQATATGTAVAGASTAASHAPAHPATPPAGNCTAAAQQPGHIVVHALAATSTGLRATATRLKCGPGVVNDIEYDPAGPARDWAFAPGGVTAELMNTQPAAFQVDLATLVRTVNACARIPYQKPPFHCFGGNDYDIALDTQGRVRTITQLFHP